ncbi:putative Prefoldin 1 protein [Naja naja]|nr:putative Prefoldin 1 protein [Naja naja]
MAAAVDLELKKAFSELQAKVIETQQKVKLADIQIDQLNRTKKHAHLTDTEIMTLAEETRMYEAFIPNLYDPSSILELSLAYHLYQD